MFYGVNKPQPFISSTLSYHLKTITNILPQQMKCIKLHSIDANIIQEIHQTLLL